MSDITDDPSSISTSGWIKGISLSILASIIGGASKLAIRKSWLLVHNNNNDNNDNNYSSTNIAAEQHDDDNNDTNDNVNATIMTMSMMTTTLDDQLMNGGRYSHIVDEITDDDHNETILSTDDIRTITTIPTGTTSNSFTNNNSLGWLPITLRISGMIGMTTLNPLCSVLAMNYASPSILAPFAGLTLVWIVLLSQPLIGEQPSQQQMIAAFLIVLGEIIIAIFGDHTNDDHSTIHDVIVSYQKTDFIIFIIVMCIWMLFLLYHMFVSVHRTSNSNTMQRFAWGVAGGSITGFQNFLKDSLTILKAYNNSNNNNNDQFPYTLFIGMFLMAIITALSGLMILTYCMKKYDVTYSASIFVGSFCISASIMSAIHYNTFANLTGIVNYIGYPTGLLILLYGVYLLLGSKTSAISATSSSSILTRRQTLTTPTSSLHSPVTNHNYNVDNIHEFHVAEFERNDHNNENDDIDSSVIT